MIEVKVPDPAYMQVPFFSEQMKMAGVCADFNSLVFGLGIDPLDLEEREGLAVICFHLCHDHHRTIARLFYEGHKVGRLVRLDPRIRGDAAAGVDRAQDVRGRMARDCQPPRGAATAGRLGAPGLLGAVATCLSVPPSTTTIGRRPCSRAPARLRHRLIGCRRA